MDGFVVVRHGTSEREGDLVLLMVGWIGVLLVAIFITQLDRISGSASARTADVLLHAVAEHGSGVLVADNARLDLFVDATAVHGRRAAGSDVLRRTGRGRLKRLRFVGRRRGIFGPAALFRI